MTGDIYRGCLSCAGGGGHGARPAAGRVVAPGFHDPQKGAGVQPRGELIPSVRDGGRNERIDFEGMSVRSYPGTAIVNGVAHMRVGPADQPIEFDSNFTAVWVDVDGSPRLVVYHSTGVPEA